MKRREFSSGLFVAGLASPMIIGPTSSLANEEGGVAELARGLSGRMQLSTNRGFVLLTQILFLLVAQIFVLSLLRRQKVFVESDLRGNQTATSQMSDMQKIGLVYLIATTLYVLPSFLPQKRNLRVIMPFSQDGRELSARPNLRLKHKNVADIPRIEVIKSRGRRVGDLYGSRSNSGAVVLNVRGLAMET
jgi:hypothetical protein